METIVVYLVIVLVPALVILVPGQFFKLRMQDRAAGKTTGSLRLLMIAILGVLVALAIGASVGYAVMVGPSLVTGIGNDIYWFTMLPALGFGILAASFASRFIGPALVKLFT